MEHQTKITPRDFFMHLLGFFTLYVGIISLLTLLFQYINVLFPDALDFYYTGILNAIRLASSTLIVVFIVFLLINWFLEKDFVKKPQKRELKFRKWLIYFTLFVSAITIIIDLIRLVYIFYSGELTTRFLLKVVVVLIVALAVFAYYLWDLKRVTNKKYSLPKIAAWVSSLIILGALITSFFVVGSPATQRLRRFDDQRINHLQSLQNEIVSYWQQKDALPESLDDLQNSITGFVPPVDPETGTTYEYIIIEPLTFELCAVFNTDSIKIDQKNKISQLSPNYYDPYQQNWTYQAGQTCFSRTIDPELNKLNEEFIPRNFD